MTHRQILLWTLLTGLAVGAIFGGITFVAHKYAPMPDPPSVESLLHWRYLALPAFTIAMYVARRG